MNGFNYILEGDVLSIIPNQEKQNSSHQDMNFVEDLKSFEKIPIKTI